MNPAIIAPAQACIELPIKTGAGLNDRMHWRKRSKIVKAQRSAACLAVKSVNKPFPCVVTMTRMSAGELDDDNLQGACKAIRDGIADAYGLADNDAGFQWRYHQERVKRGRFGVRIQIEPMDVSA